MARIYVEHYNRGRPHRPVGMRVIRTPVRAPNANPYAERVIETIRAECLDWTLIQGRRHLERTLRNLLGGLIHECHGLAA
jgi:hypothetical protein